MFDPQPFREAGGACNLEALTEEATALASAGRVEA